MNKVYTSPEFSVIESLSDFCKGLSLGLLDDRSGYTQVETEDPFGDEQIQYNIGAYNQRCAYWCNADFY